jgi:cobalamin biosynthesis protein CobD/CbiB
MHDFISHIMLNLAEIDRIPLLITALTLAGLGGLLTGGLGGYTFPLIWKIWQAILSPLIKRLDNPQRSNASLFSRGLFITIFAMLIAIIIGRFMTYTAARLPYYAILETLYLTLLLSSGALWHAALHLKNTDQTDLHAKRRGMCNALIRGSDKLICAPAFWYFIAGLPAATLYSVISFLTIYYGRDEHSGPLSFSGFFNALERLCGIVPHVIIGAALLLAALISPGANPFHALKSLCGGKNKVPYAQGGLPLNTAAYALGITLGGPYTNQNDMRLNNNWTGRENSSAKITKAELHRTLVLSLLANLMLILGITLFYVIKKS